MKFLKKCIAVCALAITSLASAQEMFLGVILGETTADSMNISLTNKGATDGPDQFSVYLDDEIKNLNGELQFGEFYSDGVRLKGVFYGNTIVGMEVLDQYGMNIIPKNDVPDMISAFNIKYKKGKTITKNIKDQDFNKKYKYSYWASGDVQIILQELRRVVLNPGSCGSLMSFLPRSPRTIHYDMLCNPVMNNQPEYSLYYRIQPQYRTLSEKVEAAIKLSKKEEMTKKQKSISKF